MPRTNSSILDAAPNGTDSKWKPTGGYLHSLDAMLNTGTTASLDIYVSNIGGSAKGLKLATLTLSTAAPSDGFSLPKEDDGWHYVRAQVTAADGSVTAWACVDED